MSEHQGGPGWDGMAELETQIGVEADEGWTQEVIPSDVVRQAQLDLERERDPFHEMTGPGYTEPPLDWEPSGVAGPDEPVPGPPEGLDELKTNAERYAAYRASFTSRRNPDADLEAGA